MKTSRKGIIMIIFLILISFAFPTISMASGNSKEIIDIDEQNKTPTSHIDYEGVNEGIAALNKEVSFFRGLAIAVFVVISVAILVIHWLRLAMAYDHALHRRKVLEDIGVTLAVISLMGGIGFIMKLLAGMAM